MREIKFRGLDEEGIWRYGSVASTISTSGEYYGVEPFLFSLIIELEYQDKIELWRYPVKPETVGQYTGINDKNDNEIYEGDILEFSMHARERGSVIFRDGSFMVVRNCDGYCIADFEDENGYFFEILGNIYEKPDLLDIKNV